LRALDLLGYTEGNDASELADERGYCPAGRRYIYAIADGSDILQRYWSTSCGEGTFAGRTKGVRALFQAQIPDYREFIRGVKL
jgi:hypothetical protein